MIQIAPHTDIAKYLLVQYMDNPRRLEARNIGVIAWAPGQTQCRFVDPESAQSFVSDMAMYGRWVSFWTDRTRKEVLTYHGKSARIDSPEYFDLLLSTQSGNYVLRDGGESLEPIGSDDVGDFAEFLFSELVYREQPTAEESPQEGDLREKCTRLFQDIGINRDFRLTRNRDLALSHQESWQEFKFDYSWGNERCDALLHRVSLASQPSATGAAFMFELVRNSKGIGIKGAQTMSLVDTSKTLADRHAVGRIQMLSQFSEVVDLATPEDAAEKVAAALGV